MKRRLEIQKHLAKVGGAVDSCQYCIRCGGEMLVDSPPDFDALSPKYADWHEAFDAYEFDHASGETWSCYLMRCQSCSGLHSHVEKRLTNPPTAETIQP